MKPFPTKRSLFALVLAGSLTMMAPSQAQQGSDQAFRFDRLDRNGDQIIDRDEYLDGRHPRMPDFSFLDQNGDDRLTQDELELSRQLLRRQRMENRRSARGPGGQPSFPDFDRNGDGRIDETEFIEARGLRIRQRAEQGRQMRGLANMMQFQDLDRNGDGAVSEAEFSSALQEHRSRRRLSHP